MRGATGQIPAKGDPAAPRFLRAGSSGLSRSAKAAVAATLALCPERRLSSGRVGRDPAAERHGAMAGWSYRRSMPNTGWFRWISPACTPNEAARDGSGFPVQGRRSIRSRLPKMEESATFAGKGEHGVQQLAARLIVFLGVVIGATATWGGVPGGARWCSARIGRRWRRRKQPTFWTGSSRCLNGSRSGNVCAQASRTQRTRSSWRLW